MFSFNSSFHPPSPATTAWKCDGPTATFPARHSPSWYSTPRRNCVATCKRPPLDNTITQTIFTQILILWSNNNLLNANIQHTRHFFNVLCAQKTRYRFAFFLTGHVLSTFCIALIHYVCIVNWTNKFLYRKALFINSSMNYCIVIVILYNIPSVCKCS